MPSTPRSIPAEKQFPHCVRTHLERRKLLAGKTVVREYSDPPRPQFLFDCGNRILSKCGRSPMLGYAVLLRLNNVNAANQMPAHGARLWSDWLALQYYFRPELITVSALPWLTPGRAFSLALVRACQRSILLSSCPVICEEYTP